MLVKSVTFFLLVVAAVFTEGQKIIGRRPGVPNQSRPATGSRRAGICKFGVSRFGCCYGWKRDNFGGCAPVCQDECVHGTCAGPNRCVCNKGYTGTTCERDLNECSSRPCSHRCMNTPGSYRCYCEHGYLLLEDGTSCSRDDRCFATRCAFGCIQHEDGFSCFCPDGLALRPDGLSCTDVDECELGTAECLTGRRCKNTYGNYMCLCPQGYKFAYVNEELDCVDENECDNNRCDPNAYCVNVVGGFQCKCNEGFAGDGYTCVQIDARTCLDTPCFQDVGCTEVQVSADSNALPEGTTSLKQYRCGPCPPTYIGDGETCSPSTIPVQVIAQDRSEGNSPLGEVSVRALRDRDDDQREILTEATTDLNGIATLQLPSGVSVELVATKDTFVDTVKTYTVQPEGVNVVKIPMEPFAELTAFQYRAATSKAFEFGTVGDDTPAFRVRFPEGAFKARDGTRVQVNYRGVDISSPDALSELPDLSRVEGEPGKRLIPLGAAELSILDPNGRTLELRQPATISFALKDYIELLGVRKTVDAYYFDTETGKWVKDGTGTITDNNGKSTWTYDTNHFTWWILAITYAPNRCLTVRACFDADCRRPAANVPIIIYGENFVFYDEYITGVSGSVCSDVFTEEHDRIRVVQNCTSESQLVIADVSKTSLCGDGPGGCQVVTFIMPDQDFAVCPDPGQLVNGVRTGDDFSLGAAVSFFCNPNFNMQGNSQRVCQQCGKWSGFKPFCTPYTEDSFSSGDSWMGS